MALGQKSSQRAVAAQEATKKHMGGMQEVPRLKRASGMSSEVMHTKSHSLLDRMSSVELMKYAHRTKIN